MKIPIDIVVANCYMSLDQLNQLQTGQVKPIQNFEQSKVILKSGNDLVATGSLIKIDDNYAVEIEHINNIN